MNAGRILRRAELDTDELRLALAPINPDNINVWPASKWLRMFWRPGIKGVTQGRLIMVHPDLLKGDPDRLAKTVVHELVHVRQFRELGYARFMFRYIRDHLRGRLGGVNARESYLQNPAEVEAREVTKRLVL
ncbi:MAG: hypothetical protein U9N56_04095 [Actinomycetota bacterium]|nr:hypothetical protein [Actinomycetota bacterium]